MSTTTSSSPPPNPSFASSTRITPLTTNTYSATIPPHWQIGAVPHGGFVASLFQRVATLHARRDPGLSATPHLHALQLSFLRRTAVGHCVFEVDVLKAGRTTGEVLVGLRQPETATGEAGTGEEAPLLVTGTIHLINFHPPATPSDTDSQPLLSLPTAPPLLPAPPPANLKNLLAGVPDKNWMPLADGGGIPEFVAFRRAVANVQFWVPRGKGGMGAVGGGDGGGAVERSETGAGFGQRKGERRGVLQRLGGWLAGTADAEPTKDSEGEEGEEEEEEVDEPPSYVDEYLAFAPHPTTNQREPLTTSALGMAVDMFPVLVEAYRGTRWWPPTLSSARPPLFWYPTLVLNMEVKRLLPPEGVDALFLRVRAVEIRDGRMDLGVTVLDERGRVVALSSHVCLVVDAGRNTKGREVKL